MMKKVILLFGFFMVFIASCNNTGNQKKIDYSEAKGIDLTKSPYSISGYVIDGKYLGEHIEVFIVYMHQKEGMKELLDKSDKAKKEGNEELSSRLWYKAMKLPYVSGVVYKEKVFDSFSYIKEVIKNTPKDTLSDGILIVRPFITPTMRSAHDYFSDVNLKDANKKKITQFIVDIKEYCVKHGIDLFVKDGRGRINCVVRKVNSKYREKLYPQGHGKNWQY